MVPRHPPCQRAVRILAFASVFEADGPLPFPEAQINFSLRAPLRSSDFSNSSRGSTPNLLLSRTYVVSTNGPKHPPLTPLARSIGVL